MFDTKNLLQRGQGESKSGQPTEQRYRKTSHTRAPAQALPYTPTLLPPFPLKPTELFSFFKKKVYVVFSILIYIIAQKIKDSWDLRQKGEIAANI